MRIRCRHAFAMLCGAAMSIVAPACESADVPPAATVAAWVKGQIDDGRLIVEFYDPAKPPKPYPGWTEFEFRLDFQFEYKTEPLRKKKGARPGPVIVNLNYTKIDVPIKHRMQLPKTLEAERWYEAGLARHELDHVRVGLHPRLAMLGKHLVQRVNRFERSADAVGDVTAEWVKARIDAELGARRDAILALVLGINQKIDKLTDHGATPLPNREEFLAGLFLKENLDEMKFTYLPEVLDIINTRDYQQTRILSREVDVELTQPSKN